MHSIKSNFTFYQQKWDGYNKSLEMYRKVAEKKYCVSSIDTICIRKDRKHPEQRREKKKQLFSHFPAF